MMTPKKRSGNYCGFSIGKRNEARRRLRVRGAIGASVLAGLFVHRNLVCHRGYPSKSR
jgi:hypothetical protein